MTTAIRILHTTLYRYSQPVHFGPHRLLIRPRDGHDLRLISSAISINPRPVLRWHFDTFGNSVVSATFHDPSDILEIQSELLIRRFSHEDFLASPDRIPSSYPFTYSDEDAVDLAPFIALENPQEATTIGAWLEAEIGKGPDEILAFLRNLSDTINTRFQYIRRERTGTQTAAETISLGTGSCRDFAFLLIEAARHCGFAARFVTGYLNTETGDGQTLEGGGATHAWAEIYLPEEGWIEFDPTNRVISSPDLIRVAVTRTPSQAVPISGTFANDDNAEFLGMDVSVNVRTEPYDIQGAA